MKLSTQLLLGYAALFAPMIIVAGVTYQSTNTLIENQGKVDQSHQIMNRARLLMRLMVDMQTGVRGYALVGRGEFLEPYEAAKTSYEITLSELKGMNTGDVAMSALLKEIQALADRWQAEIALPVIQARRDLVSGAAGADMRKVIALADKQADRTNMDIIRDSITKFVDAESTILSQREISARRAAARSIWIVVFGTGLAVVFGIIAIVFTIRAIMYQVGGEPSAIAAIADHIARGNLDVKIGADAGTVTGIKAALGTMLTSLRENRAQIRQKDWLKTGIARLNETMRGDPQIEILASKVISEVCLYLDAQIGAFYLVQETTNPVLSLLGSYAYSQRKNLSNVFKPGEGLVGQAFLEKKQILVSKVPADYVKVISGLGERTPLHICVTPFLYEGRVKCVVEIGTFKEMTDRELEYLTQAMPSLGLAVESAQSRTRLASSLEESQRLSEELQAQQEELKTANEALQEQAQQLEESEEKLKTQQEELQVSNEELEEKNDLLERQKREVERARKDIQNKAEELALASKYKSEFLSNMSHELRTPLNSLLLLAQGLAQNRNGNLTDEQVESARIIYAGGSDLLNLINEILDLSKIEAGRMDLHIGRVPVSDLADSVRASYGHMARDKGLELDVIVNEEAPTEITTDRKRLEQVIRNLVSNAIKFTEHGNVQVTFGRPAPSGDPTIRSLASSEWLAIAVKDSGIGIAPEQQKIIFEAFQQADGGTARKYGGTGLGLSISRELTRLLGGEIQLESEPGSGSTFTICFPVAVSTNRQIGPGATATVTVSRTDARESHGLMRPRPVAVQIEDDRQRLEKNDRVILVIEDDADFARLLHRKCQEKGFKCLAAPTGEAGLELAQEHLPSAVILDIRLPGMDGWGVLSALKESTRTRHIPVHVVSVEESSTEALRRGAVGHAVKPLGQEDLEETFRRIEQVSAAGPKRLLVVEDDPKIRAETVKLIGNGDVKVDEVANAAEAIAALRSSRYDCVVMDLGLPDLDGGELLARLEREGVNLPPVIVHTARDLTLEEEADIRERAESIVIKDVRSQERLLDEVSLFLHRVVGRMPENKRKIIRALHDTDEALQDKKILIVDDDMRTTFAVSRLLAERGMQPIKAQNGEKALQLLDEHPDTKLVLMDIMMPVMDGYDAMQRIRAQERFRNLPIIALTAKAMPEDRARCLASGASDYLTKPVDPGRLVSMLRVWLYR